MKPTRMEKRGPTTGTITTGVDPGTTTEGTIMKMDKARDAQGNYFILDPNIFWSYFHSFYYMKNI